MELPCDGQNRTYAHWLACTEDVTTAAGNLITAVCGRGALISELREQIIGWHECHHLALLNQLATEYHAHGMTAADIQLTLLEHQMLRGDV